MIDTSTLIMLAYAAALTFGVLFAAVVICFLAFMCDVYLGDFSDGDSVMDEVAKGGRGESDRSPHLDLRVPNPARKGDGLVTRRRLLVETSSGRRLPRRRPQPFDREQS